jgi:MFS transporter, ACS family, tartrate transporter
MVQMEAAATPPGLLRKLMLHVLPLLVIGYFVNYLDRTAVSVAALQMRTDLRLSEAAFGLGAGLFFVGYTLFEVPSNILLHKVGPRRWLARIMISWGIITIATLLAQGPASLYALRVLLGIAEAGAYPGIVFYFTKWFPARTRGRAISALEVLTALSLAFAAVIDGALLTFDQTMGLAGWQWVFLVSGIPAVVLGVLILFYLPDSPEKVRWLTPEERDWLVNTLAVEAKNREKEGVATLRGALTNPRILYLSLLYFAMVVGFWGITFWLPQIVKTHFAGISDFGAAALSAIPWVMAVVALILVSRNSDRTGERRWHIAIPCLIGAGGLVISVFTHSPVVSLLAIGLAAAGQRSATPVFWNLPAGLANGIGAAGALALINSIGNIGGFVGPYIMGAISAATGTTNGGLLLFAGCLAVAAIMAIGFKQVGDNKLEPHHQTAVPKT